MNIRSIDRIERILNKRFKRNTVIILTMVDKGRCYTRNPVYQTFKSKGTALNFFERSGYTHVIVDDLGD